MISVYKACRGVATIYIAGFLFFSPMERSMAGAACQVFVEQQSSVVR